MFWYHKRGEGYISHICLICYMSSQIFICHHKSFSTTNVTYSTWWQLYHVYILIHDFGKDRFMINMLIQYIPRNMHTVFALLCFVVVIHWLIFPYPSGLLHWHCGNLTIAPVPAKQPWWIWINTSCEFIMNDCITTTKQSTTKPCAYFLGYTVYYPTLQSHQLYKTSIKPVTFTAYQLCRQQNVNEKA